MLKDVTLGQFFPGSSIVHRLDPRCKLLLTIVYIAALFTAQSYVSYAVMLIVTGILYQFGKYLNAMMMALYTPELYETAIRTTGNGLATSWGRMGSIVGPIVLAGVMTSFGVYVTMYIAAAMVIIPGLLVFLFGPETKDKKF